eukprot:scaffold26475_cov86-Isochrysis_galbana.AAC.2
MGRGGRGKFEGSCRGRGRRRGLCVCAGAEVGSSPLCGEPYLTLDSAGVKAATPTRPRRSPPTLPSQPPYSGARAET